MSTRLKRLSIVLLTSLLFVLSAGISSAKANSSDVVVDRCDVSGNEIAVTLTNHSSSHRNGEVVLMVSLADGSLEQIAVRFSLNGGSTATYTTSTSTDVTGAVEQGIQEGSDPI